MRAAAHVVRWVVLAALLVGALAVFTGRVRLEQVLTGSMVPAYPAGTLVAVTPVDPRRLRVGDVVMFVPPPPYRTPTGGPVLHRVASVTTAPDGHLLLRTKGDANPAQDPWTVDASRGGVDRLRASSVVAGRVLAMVLSSFRWPAAVLWPGLLLLWWATRRRPAPAYRPRHAS